MDNIIKLLIKYILVIVNNYFPKFLRNIINTRIDNYKSKKLSIRKNSHFVKISEINDILEKINFENDIIIHSSLSSIGKIEGGANKLVELILSKIDLSKYTIIVPALPYNTLMKNYLDDLESFNIRKAKNAMGAISNIIMNMPSSKRSLHPTHSVVAIGRMAEYYTQNHENCSSPFCKDSPFYKLVTNNGKILMFGVGLNSVTNFHVYEDMILEYLPFKLYTKKDYIIKCYDHNDQELYISTKCHNPFLSSKRECEISREYLIKNEVITINKIGSSEISLLDAKGHTKTLLMMLLEGISIYGKVKLDKAQNEIILSKINELK